MHRLHLVFCIVVATQLTSACTHITTKVPGTLDLRSDGSSLPASTMTTSLPSDLARSGFDGFVKGEGVQQYGSRVTVADRKVWFIGLVAVMNESATEEIQAALGSDALRRVKIGESHTIVDVAIVYVGNLVTSLVGLSPLYTLFMPTRTVTFEGERVRTGARGEAPASPNAL
jgi:hypothetical protein